MCLPNKLRNIIATTKLLISFALFLDIFDWLHSIFLLFEGFYTFNIWRIIGIDVLIGIRSKMLFLLLLLHALPHCQIAKSNLKLKCVGLSTITSLFQKLIATLIQQQQPKSVHFYRLYWLLALTSRFRFVYFGSFGLSTIRWVEENSSTNRNINYVGSWSHNT